MKTPQLCNRQGPVLKTVREIRTASGLIRAAPRIFFDDPFSRQSGNRACPGVAPIRAVAATRRQRCGGSGPRRARTRLHPRRSLSARALTVALALFDTRSEAQPSELQSLM